MTADIRRTDADSTDAGSPGADDWLGEDDALDWDADATQGSPAVAPPDAPSAAADAATVRRRRLLAALALVALVVVGIVIAIVVAGGGDSTAEQTTTFVPTTQPVTPTTTPPATTPVAPTVKLPASGTMRRGDSGTEVKGLQQALTTLGYDVGTVDASFGPTTETAVAQFQASKGLPPDGVVGEETVAALNKALATKSGV